MRTFSGNVNTLINRSDAASFYLIRILGTTSSAYDTVKILHTSAPFSITVPGVGTFTPVSGLFSVEPPKLSNVVDRETYKIVYADIDRTIISLFDSGLTGAKATVWVGFYNTTNVSISGVAPGLPLIEEESRTNFLLYSEQFDVAVWANNTPGLTITANNVLSPIGTLTADSSPGIGTRYQGSTTVLTSGSPYTYSLYIKPTDPTKTIKCYVDGNFGAASAFNSATAESIPSTLTTSSSSNTISQGILDVGNGWYRVWITFSTAVSTSSVNCHLYPINTDIHSFWGAQLEAGSYPTSYIATRTSTVTRPLASELIIAYEGVKVPTPGTVILKGAEV